MFDPQKRIDWQNYVFYPHFFYYFGIPVHLNERQMQINTLRVKLAVSSLLSLTDPVSTMDCATFRTLC